jgi:hypothetical protein
VKQYFSLAQGFGGKRHDLSDVSTIFPAWRCCHERELIMFWIFSACAGLFGFAVMYGQLSVSFAILKFALLAAVGLIAVLSIMLLNRKSK